LPHPMNRGGPSQRRLLSKLGHATRCSFYGIRAEPVVSQARSDWLSLRRALGPEGGGDPRMPASLRESPEGHRVRMAPASCRRAGAFIAAPCTPGSQGTVLSDNWVGRSVPGFGFLRGAPLPLPQQAWAANELALSIACSPADVDRRRGIRGSSRRVLRKWNQGITQCLGSISQTS